MSAEPLREATTHRIDVGEMLSAATFLGSVLGEADTTFRHAIESTPVIQWTGEDGSPTCTLQGWGVYVVDDVTALAPEKLFAILGYCAFRRIPASVSHTHYIPDDYKTAP